MIKIKEFRLERKIQQQELAKLLHIGKGSISNWEVGRTEPNIDMIVRLADVFNCTTDELLGRESSGEHRQTGLGITPLENKLLQAFRKLSEDDQNKAVGILQALAVMS